MKPSNEIEKQVESAYDHRGHVTIRLKSGEAVIGFVFNREFSNPRQGAQQGLLKEDRFVDVMVKDKDDRRRIKIDEVLAIELTGKDYAETFEEGLKRVKETGSGGDGAGPSSTP